MFVYETSSPDAKRWKAGPPLSVVSEEYKNLGEYFVSINGDVALASVENQDTTLIDVALFAKDKKWDFNQILSVGRDVSSVGVYSETVVLGSLLDPVVDANGVSTLGSVSVLYPSTEKFHLKPKGKPQPTRWSVQQKLVPPSAIGATDAFGATVAIDNDRMVITNAFDNLYVYERPVVHGQWSLQQVILTSGTQGEVTLQGSTITLQEDAGLAVYDETADWDCLIVSVADHFSDGWDGAELTVDVPGGDKDFFSSRCDLANPFQFRYCPADRGDSGLYKFSIPGAVKAKFHWEMVWRVYEEKSGNWFTGNWDTKMDFDWDAEHTQFTHKKMDKLLPNNITCQECRQKPQPKLKGKTLRELHSKDSTHAPTISPAPTVATTNSLVSWQTLSMITQGNDWFDSQHKGTNYYISDKEGRRLLSTGTMCPWELTTNSKTCWEEFPDGEYILRVGGALDRDTDHTFRYCKSANDLKQESQMIFRVSNGDCEIRSYFTSNAMCLNKQGLVQLEEIGTLSLSIIGVSGDLGANEKAHIASAVATVLDGISAEDLRVTAASSFNSRVTVTIQVNAHTAGTDFADVHALNAFEEKVNTALQTGENAIAVALASSDGVSAVHSATRVEFHDFRLSGSDTLSVGQTDASQEVTNMLDTSGDSYSASSDSSSSSRVIVSILAEGGYVLAAVGAVAVVGYFVTRRIMSTVHVAEPVPTTENIAKSKGRSSLSGASVLTAKDLHELVTSEEASLKAMLQDSA